MFKNCNTVCDFVYEAYLEIRSVQIMKRVLYLAFSVKESTAFLKQVDAQHDNYLISINKYDNFTSKNFILFKLFFFCMFFINKILGFAFSKANDELFNYLDRNIISEILFNRVFKEYDIINIHWLGYDILPNKSINRLNHQNINVFNHDWQRFTGGCHVPTNCNSFLRGCHVCPKSHLVRAVKDYEDRISFYCVSQYQKQLVQKSFKLPLKVKDNQVNASMQSSDKLDLFPMSWKCGYKVLFIGINLSNGDNKNTKYCQYLIDSFTSDITYIGVNSPSLKALDISISYLKNKKLMGLIAQVDLVVVPSKIETFSLVAHESLMMRTPILVSNTHPLFDLSNPLIFEAVNFEAETDFFAILSTKRDAYR
jgi:glycosyltransferase involved in cell wall biosynthesis